MKKIKITYYSTPTKQMFGIKQTEAATVFGLPGKSLIQGISPFLLNNIIHSSKQKGQLCSYALGPMEMNYSLSVIPQSFVSNYKDILQF